MIKIHNDDSIADIIIKITQSNQKDIILEFPFGHPILHNYTSLKILKSKAGKKNIIIITSDIASKNIGEKLDIKYSLIHQKDLVEYNYSIPEYARFLYKSYIQNVFLFFQKKTSTGPINKYKNKYLQQKSRIGFFLIGLLISIFLMLFIFYFAVNKTYIYITPDISIKAKARNLTFQHGDESLLSSQKNIIRLKKQEKLVYLEQDFATTGINQEDIKVAQGEVTLYNKGEEEVALRANSRLQAPNGAIYTIPTSVTIPGANYSNTGTLQAGELQVRVQSKPHDIDGKIAGEKVNIHSGTLLFFPGLANQKDTIFAYTKTDISGGSNTFKKIITDQDIKNAKKVLEEKLRVLALEKIKLDIIESNKTNNVEYQILGVDGILKYSQLNISGIEKLKIGNIQDNFQLSGSIKITTYIYNKQQVLSKLKTTIQNSLLEEIEQVLYINEESLRISNTIYKNENSPFTIKATAQVEVFYIHNFLDEKNNSVQKLKSMIGGMEKIEAEKMLINNPQISNVQIDIQPFFIKNVSKIPDNIIFRIVQK